MTNKIELVDILPTTAKARRDMLTQIMLKEVDNEVFKRYKL